MSVQNLRWLRPFHLSKHLDAQWLAAVPRGKTIGFAMSLDRLLNEIIPYRMQAVATLNLATRLGVKWADHPPPLQIYVNGKSQVEGNLHAFTNPAIEAGLVHCRALLEFLG
jgi:hypothetical protein